MLFEFKGNKIGLISIKKSEANLYYKLYANLETKIALGNVKLQKYADNQENIIEEIINNPTKQHFSIYNLETKKFVGSCGFYDIDFRNQKASVSIALKEKGYGTEAMNLILDYGFIFLSLNKVSAYIYEYNKKSLNLFKKIGFKKVGEERAHIKIGEKFYGRVVMDILRDEFYANNEHFLLKDLNI